MANGTPWPLVAAAALSQGLASEAQARPSTLPSSHADREVVPSAGCVKWRRLRDGTGRTAQSPEELDESAEFDQVEPALFQWAPQLPSPF